MSRKQQNVDTFYGRVDGIHTRPHSPWHGLSVARTVQPLTWISTVLVCAVHLPKSRIWISISTEEGRIRCFGNESECLILSPFEDVSLRPAQSGLNQKSG